MKPLARKVYERSQNITVLAMRAVRPGAYRIVDGVIIEDGGDLLVEPKAEHVSGVRRKAEPK